MKPRVLLLGGTTEAAAMARALADTGVEAIYSYAGRTEAPVDQPIPVRTGGFGGAEGLARWIADNGITCLVDATHPFAVRISRNAIVAAELSGIALLALERPAWTARSGDRWQHVPDVEAAVAALPDRPTDVFLAIGRQNLKPFAAKTHRYHLRLVDPEPCPEMKAASVTLDRGPFTVDGDLALMRRNAITHVVSKNSGGSGAEAKLIVARMIGAKVVMITRPDMPFRHVFRSPADVLRFMHHADLGV